MTCETLTTITSAWELFSHCYTKRGLWSVTIQSILKHSRWVEISKCLSYKPGMEADYIIVVHTFLLTWKNYRNPTDWQEPEASLWHLQWEGAEQTENRQLLLDPLENRSPGEKTTPLKSGEMVKANRCGRTGAARDLTWFWWAAESWVWTGWEWKCLKGLLDDGYPLPWVLPEERLLQWRTRKIFFWLCKEEGKLTPTMKAQGGSNKKGHVQGRLFQSLIHLGGSEVRYLTPDPSSLPVSPRAGVRKLKTTLGRSSVRNTSPGGD